MARTSGLQVVAAVDEVLRQRVEQLGIRRRIRLAHVVLGLDEAAIEEVLPVAVHERLGEERIRPCCSSSRQARGADRRPAAMSSVGSPRPAGLTVSFVFLFTACATPRLWKMISSPAMRGRLAPDLAEERGEAVVVLLAPLLERMMMALRALHAHAEEELRHVLELLLRLLHALIPSDRRVRHDRRRSRRASRARSGRRACSPSRLSRIQAWKAKFAVMSRWSLALVAQQRGPFVGEVVGVVRAGEQRLDHAVALVRILARRGTPCVSSTRRQTARDVERHAAEERRVIADGRGRHADLLELREDLFVDEVPRRRADSRPARRAGSMALKTATLP